jgi:heme exporter protein CcmD
MIAALLATPYAGYILSAYGLAALITLGLIVRAVLARHSQLKALHDLQSEQD